MDGENEGAILIEDGGTGGGGEGGAGGGEDDQQIDREAGGGEGGAEGGAGEHEGETDEERQTREAAERGDQRARPLDVRKAIREITTKDPDFAKQYPRLEKEISRALFTGEQVTKLGGMQQISAALETIEAHGGLEGIEEMAEELEASKQLEGGLERGDPAVVAGWAKDFPDGFKRSVVPILDTLEKLDEERYEHISSYIIAKTFEKFGAFGVMTSLGQALQALKPEDTKEAVKHFNELTRFLGQTKTLAGRAKADPYASRSQELDERESRIAEDTAKAFKGAVRADVNTSVTNEMNKQLRDHLRTLKVFRVESGTANRMRKEINRELQRLVNTDPEHQRRYDSVMASGDRNRAAQYIIKAAYKKLPEAIKSVARDFNLRPTGRPGAGGQQRRLSSTSSRGEGGDQVQNGRPKTSEVDFRRTDKAYWLANMHGHGEAWLQNGKKAKW
jgi:hypothetical protein